MPDREIAITYNSYTVGGSSGRKIQSYYVQEVGYETSSLEFSFIVSAATNALFAAACIAAEAAFRKPRANLSATLGVEPLIAVTPASAVGGFDTDPVITKREAVANTSRSRKYTVRITFGMPADNVATSGRRYGTISISYSPARRRTITFSGTYTGFSGTASARSAYEAAIATYVSGKLASFGVTAYDLAEEPRTEENETDKTLSYTRVIREVIYSEAGVTDDPQIVSQEFRYSRSKVGPGDTQDVPTARLVTYNITYVAWIDKTLTQNLTTKWAAIRTWIMTKIAADAAGPVALLDETPEFDWTDNRITARMTVQAVTGSSVIENRVTTRDVIEYGKVLVPVWDGQPLSRFIYQGPGRRQRIVTDTYKQVGNASSVAGGGGGGGGGGFVAGRISGPPGFGGGVGFGGAGGAPGIVFRGGGLSGGGGGATGGGGAQSVPDFDGGLWATLWVLVSIDRSVTPTRIGIDGYTFDVTEYAKITVIEYYVQPAAANVGT